MKKISCLLATIIIIQSVNAGTVDTVETMSNAMKKTIKAVIIKPDNYDKGKEYPTVYLLHGAGGNYANWIKIAPNLPTLADQYNLIIVCPDGRNSWYFDSPVDESYKYETYVADELVKWVDGKYKTIKNRNGRAITGLSMGGHGALYLSFKHQDVFGAAGSMSGGVDIRPFPKNWNLPERLGSYAQNRENWENNSVINLTYLLVPNALSLIIDCGTEDFFFQVNNNLHDKLLESNIPHDYIVRPGAHVGAYWTNAINYQMLFMSRYFEKRIS